MPPPTVRSGALQEGAGSLTRALAEFVGAVHDAYVREVAGAAPATRMRLPLLAGPFRVAVVGARHLYLLAFRGGPATAPEQPAAQWTVSFYDGATVPALRSLDESSGPDVAAVARLIGAKGLLYQVAVEPGTSLDPHGAAHLGAGLANEHLAALRTAQEGERHEPCRR